MLCRPAVETCPVAHRTMAHPLWVSSRATISRTTIAGKEGVRLGRQLQWLQTFGKRDRTATPSAKPPTQGEQAQGGAAQGEQDQRETATTWIVMTARHSKAFHKAAGILKHPAAPHDQWHIDWLIMGQQTLGMNCEAYSLVVIDVGSGLVLSSILARVRTLVSTWTMCGTLCPTAKTWSHSQRLSHIGCASTASCCCTALAACLS